MKDKRVHGLSQLDYLWVNYGNFNISSSITSTPEESIPSQALLLNLLQKLGDKSIGSISLEDNHLILYNQSGFEINRVDVSELVSLQIYVTDFGLKLVQETDIANGCPFQLYTKVYYITLSDGKTFYAKLDVLDGFDTSTIQTQIIDNHIVSSLKIDKDLGNVILTGTNGLKATLPIAGLGVPVLFLYLTLEQYDDLVNPQSGVIYFILDRSYFYFGNERIGNRDNDSIELRINNIEKTLTWKNYG